MLKKIKSFVQFVKENKWLILKSSTGAILLFSVVLPELISFGIMAYTYGSIKWLQIAEKFMNFAGALVYLVLVIQFISWIDKVATNKMNNLK